MLTASRLYFSFILRQSVSKGILLIVFSILCSLFRSMSQTQTKLDICLQRRAWIEPSLPTPTTAVLIFFIIIRIPVSISKVKLSSKTYFIFFDFQLQYNTIFRNIKMVYIIQHVDIEGPGLIENFLLRQNRTYEMICLYESEPLPDKLADSACATKQVRP